MSLDNRRPAAGPSKDEIRMNMAALQRIDPFIVQIIHSSSQVALYKFLQSEWDKTEVEGTLFVYARKCAPKYGFLILNRKSSDNWIQPITGGMDTQLQSPFLLYKSKDEVYGIWFYEQPDCFLIYDTINKLVRECEDASQNINSNGGAGNDLASLLMEAQGQTPEAEKRKQKSHASKPSPSGGEKLLRLLSRDVDGQNGPPGSNAPSGSSVEAFFAQVSRQEHGQNGGGFFIGDGHPPPVQQAAIPGFINQAPQQAGNIFPFGGHHHQQQQQQLQPSPLLHLQNQITNTTDDGARHVMLQTLLSNPGVVSVESLERAHREESESPVAVAGTNGGSGELPPMPLTATKADDLEAAFKNKVKIAQSPSGSGRGGGSAGKRGRNVASGGGHQQQQQQQRPGKSPQQQRQGHQPVARQAQPFSYASAVAYGEPGKSPRGPSKTEGNVPTTAATANNPSPLKPAPVTAAPPVTAKRSFEVEPEPVQLLSPMVFAAPEPAVTHALAGPAMSAATFMPNPLQLNGAYESDKLEPLTKGQFLQAFLHLLRTDDNFVGQLHQAYVEALNTKLH